MQPFHGIRVIDMTHVLAGPFATYQLAVLGANVIEVEHPDDPDMICIEGATPVLNERPSGTYVRAQNGNTRALAVDIKTEAGQDVIVKLAENDRTGSLDALRAAGAAAGGSDPAAG
jgi:crotonobetainyl-CoA:carnitine CoA-transferase CaiB-like acyl-CoA transferase